jgi:hypothetical protein
MTRREEDIQMKVKPPVKSVMTLATLGGLVLAAGIVAFRAQADQWDKRTSITVDQPFQVRDTYLEPGTYVFKLLDSNSDRHVVQIFNADGMHLINTVMAIPNYRLEPTGNSRFMFWETPQGSAKALRAWFYPGDNFGQEFPYPKQLRQIAVALPPQPPPQAAAPAPAAPLNPQPVPEEPAPQVLNRPAPQVETPVEIAQNNPPPAPVTPQPEPPQVLPKTASPYPLFGLAGLFAFGLYGLVRRLA